MKNLIAPRDGSPLAEQVLPHVEALAKTLNLNVNLVRVTASRAGHYQYVEVSARNTDRFDQYTQDADAGATEYLRQIKGKFLQSGVATVVEHLMHGNAAAEILDLSHNIQDGLWP